MGIHKNAVRGKSARVTSQQQIQQNTPIVAPYRKAAVGCPRREGLQLESSTR
jgi:hypothetical protein